MDPLFSQVIVNDAYVEPTQHLNLLRRSASESEVLPGRRPAGYYVGVGSEADQAVTQRVWREFTGVTKVRERVGAWRAAGYPHVTPVTRALLQWWNTTDRPRINLFFCQREAVETIIWLTEAPASDRAGLDELRAPDPFVRHCCKVATGAGKTTVMAMLAVWSIVNKVTNRHDARFAEAVLVICPNLTVKERLRTLFPSDPRNEYDDKALLPPGQDFRERLAQGRFQVSNWHQLAVQDDGRKRQVLQRGEESDGPFCKRVLHDLGTRENLLVFNDEAHHAYRKNPDAKETKATEELLETEDLDEFEREATIWVEGLDRVHRDRKIRLCVDLSATPYYIARSGYPDGRPFPWIVSDFGLVDAVESGIVKIPRVPKGDDSGDPEPRYLRLWDHIKKALPKRAVEGDPAKDDLVKLLMESEGALVSLARLWQKTFTTWRARPTYDVPPCMIVVCNNTRTAELMANHIGSGEVRPELRNTDTEERTLRIDSALLRKAEGEGDPKGELLRKKVATVGRPGTPEEAPGGQVRCVVSVAMLSEGWDARNVTQILGLRAFSSQLLCEQVIGRGLRRSSYENLREPEYVDIYGVPFELLPVQRDSPGGNQEPATIVRALPDRVELEITFPRVANLYPDVGTELEVDTYRMEPLDVLPEVEPSRVGVAEGVTYYGTRGQGTDLGVGAEEMRAEDVYGRVQTTAFRITQAVVATLPEEHRPYLFQRVLAVVQDYLATKVNTHGLPLEMVGALRYRTEIAERVRQAIRAKTGEAILRPVYDLMQPTGSTRHVAFSTRKPVYAATRSHVNYVVCDPAHDDVPVDHLWEYRVAAALDAHAAVKAFVKNDHLDFIIRYKFEGAWASYLPDFVAVVAQDDGSDLNVVVEVKGDEDNRDRAKYTFARSWVDAVNRDAQHGRWAFVVVKDPAAMGGLLAKLVGSTGG